MTVCKQSAIPTQDSNLIVPALETLLKQYQDVNQVDAMSRIQKDIDETKEVMLNTLDKLLIRGEKLEELAQKSQDLSFQSKAFMKKSQDLNRCCTLV